MVLWSFVLEDPLDMFKVKVRHTHIPFHISKLFGCLNWNSFSIETHLSPAKYQSISGFVKCWTFWLKFESTCLSFRGALNWEKTVPKVKNITSRSLWSGERNCVRAAQLITCHLWDCHFYYLMNEIKLIWSFGFVFIHYMKLKCPSYLKLFLKNF